ncbi:hypothetical protein [Turneriella parva]|uniref:Lipoprotein n=1 Tax=Turneriella parva (strain ATCC BAA-1111 / DSM 21527 / NCTC 11395 / H) TaxID=869212 RepID=I4BBS1_TURPD|nr:hypothetical protein [Turneriella parva]AFM14728.1 hypothetical protein Turpa_4095 [Turneriella parva DSM 21527]
MKINRAVKPRFAKATILLFFFAGFGACNIEVGNPDTGEAPVPLTRRLNVSVIGGEPCQNTSDDSCIAAPINVGGAHLALRYEVTSVSLSLASTQFKPQPAEGTRTNLSLLKEATIEMQSTDLSQAGGTLALAFEPAVKGDAVLQMKGYITGELAGVKLRLPMTIEEGDPLLAESETSGSAPLAGVTFDANQWLDFTDQPLSGKQLLEGLTSGACQTLESKSCSRYTSQVSRVIANKVMRSMGTVRQAPKNSPKQRR